MTINTITLFSNIILIYTLREEPPYLCAMRFVHRFYISGTAKVFSKKGLQVCTFGGKLQYCFEKLEVLEPYFFYHFGTGVYYETKL